MTDTPNVAAVIPLFDVEQLAAMPNARRAEAGVERAVRAAAEAGKLTPEHAGLIAGALVGARALDRAEALADKTAVYAIAQLLPPFQRAMHGLGLPLEAAPGPQTEAGKSEPADAPDAASWLSDAFGPS